MKGSSRQDPSYTPLVYTRWPDNASMGMEMLRHNKRLDNKPPLWIPVGVLSAAHNPCAQ